MFHQSELIAQNIEQYLKEHEQKEMIRFITCGSVDDGKSTLIGRLLHDSKLIYEDQLSAIKNDTKRLGSAGEGELDLALLVDGLQAEREQGITIDVAYRYFSTEKRKFIIADTPGHEQYTRNMATGASTADLAIILIDARRGVLAQTKRHSYIAHLLGIRHIIVAINKMDMVGYDQLRFNEIVEDYKALAAEIGIKNASFFPVSALKGDNIVLRSENMAWWSGEALMSYLETTPIDRSRSKSFRFPVQFVIRPDLNFRGFAGTIISGAIKVGDEIVALPSGKTSRVERIATFDGDLQSAGADMAVAIALADEIDISRGDLLIKRGEPEPLIADSFEADLVWLGETPLAIDKSYLLKIGTKIAPARVTKIEYLVDVNTLEKLQGGEIVLNTIARVVVVTDQRIVFDPYEINRQAGAFILIDRLSHATSAAGMARSVVGNAAASSIGQPTYSAFELELNALIRKQFPHWQAIDISKGR
ncbi:sulfate adenylyltransferase subunit 1 [Campylobacterota bacterium]|nr:sulfate adenylyltransferase subunit 1 [Campylobacterota bacterium]